jgi:hypothetical protein
MTTSQDRIPHLTRDGESIWRLEDFEALIAEGVVSIDTIAHIERKTGTAPEVTNPVIHDNMARASRAFKALQAYAEDYAGGYCEAEHLIADLLNDLHHLSDAYGVSWETALCVADGNYTDEID